MNCPRLYGECPMAGYVRGMLKLTAGIDIGETLDVAWN